MDPEQQPDAGSMAPEASGTPPAPRRGRRSGRGRRGRGGRRPHTSAPPPSAPPADAADLPQPVAESAPVERETPPPPYQEPQRAPLIGVQQAIEEVNQIIETLRATLDDMDAVLETLELAERQKNADEQEIETLRRGLRQLHRPREGGPHPPRH